jgi:outer membrane protein assembly factor BamB
VSNKPSNLLVGEELYVISDGGIVSCRDANTGRSYWEQRIGESYSASPTLASGLIYIFDEKGQGTVIRPGTKPHILASNRLDEGCLATPAFSGGTVFLRTTGHLYRIEE